MDIMHEQMRNFRRNVKTILKANGNAINKNTKLEMNNSFNSFMSRLDI